MTIQNVTNCWACFSFSHIKLFDTGFELFEKFRKCMFVYVCLCLCMYYMSKMYVCFKNEKFQKFKNAYILYSTVIHTLK